MINVDINNKTYKYQSYDKTSKPPKWQNKNNFVKQLTYIQSYLNKRGKYNDLKKNSNCKLCDTSDIKSRVYTIDKIMWDNGLLHYIKKHKFKPSDYFIGKIFTYQPGKKILSVTLDRKIKGIKIVKKNKVYLKLDKNQLFIMDALYEHGSKQIYKDKHHDTIFKYSEHSGLLDFNDKGLEKIIVSGKTTRIDKDDDEIYLPKNMVDAYDYEYIFHTHPATPSVGGRAKDGVLYEFPSLNDIFHFIDHYNNGKTQGSIVIAPEGMYVIRKHNVNNKKIKIDEDEFENKFNSKFEHIQKEAINKYGTNITENKFYNKISQNLTFVNKLNNMLHKYQIHVDYFYRVLDKHKRWVLDSVYLPVYVIEPESI